MKYMLFIEYPKCSTCQKAKKWLTEKGIAFEDRHIIEENPTREELEIWYHASGLPLKRFFNTSGMKYKELNLKEKLPDMSEEQQLDLLATDGMLVKRPVLVGESFVVTGFKEKEWMEKLGL
nr:arsenate reductase family protein [Blautia coccoides]